jgi:di-heme oxidoreductase (putative peroxidase)
MKLTSMTWVAAIAVASSAFAQSGSIGSEAAVPTHLRDGEEFSRTVPQLVEYGKRLFMANWTEQDGGGRPLSKGTGQPLSDRTRPLTGQRAFNRISGPDANSCQGCHNLPYAIAGGGGDVTTSAFEMAQRFDFVTFDRRDVRATAGAVDEAKRPVALNTVGNLRSTPGLFGAGYLEMVARQITRDLQRARDAIRPGHSRALESKGVSFGTLSRRANGRWDTRAVQGLSRASLLTRTATDKPSLIVRPWQQSGGAASLREMTNTSFNQHHGIQTTERFGVNTDPDGDGVMNEMTRADVTAAAIFQATLPVPGRVIPNDPEVERAVLAGERTFARIRCTTCHVPALPLDEHGWIYSEPGPYNPPGNLRRTGVRSLEVDLTDPALPQPRLNPSREDPAVLLVPAYTDFKLHDITDPADADAREPLDAGQPPQSAGFTAGNRRFLTRRLWGAANTPPYFHHGLFTTMREAVLAHSGEALEQRQAFQGLPHDDQDALIEFLKSLQVLPPGTKDLVVDDHYRPKVWRK